MSTPADSAQVRRSTSLQQSQQLDRTSLPWGHNLVDQPENTFRIGLLNTGGIPVDATNSKTTILRQYISKIRPDAMALTEMNVHWKSVSVGRRLPERTLGWWECLHLNTAYYEGYKVGSSFQPGGVSLWSINKGAHRVMQHGQDKRGLGRWAWTRYQGRNGVTLRVIAAYRPVLNKTGIMSVWSQQRAYFDGLNEDRCPRDMFTVDLCNEMIQWKESGDQLILGLDANEDIRAGQFSSKMAHLGMTEAIVHQHGYDAPATYKRGSAPIDGLYVSKTLLGLRCGYLKFEEQFDHRLVWLDVPLEIALGHNLPPIVHAKARRLKCEDPRIVAKYQDAFKIFLETNALVEQALWLQSAAVYPCSPIHEEMYNHIDDMRVAGMKKAERKCRKLKTGAIPFSPAYSAARTRIEAWSLIVKYLRGGEVDTSYLARKAKKAMIDKPWERVLNDALAGRTAAYRDEKRLAKSAQNSRTTWLESLAEARAEAGTLSKAQEILNMRKREDQRRTARIIRWVNNKLRAGSVTAVVAPDAHGNWVEVSDKEGIERALIHENMRRFNQARSTPFL